MVHNRNKKSIIEKNQEKDLCIYGHMIYDKDYVIGQCERAGFFISSLWINLITIQKNHDPFSYHTIF